MNPPDDEPDEVPRTYVLVDKPDEETRARLTEVATRAVLSAASGLTGARRVETKSGHNDVVTEHDLEAEQVIAEILREAVPDSRILGEEGVTFDGGGPITWHVDPIDGTSNYATGLPLYCLSVGATYNGRPCVGVIHDPNRGETFVASNRGVTLNGRLLGQGGGGAVLTDENAVLLTNFPYEGTWYEESHVDRYRDVLRAFRAVRRTGSSALALAWVAAGRAAVCCELRSSPWDHAAGFALVEAAGGTTHAVNSCGRATDNPAEACAYVAAGPDFCIDNSVLAHLLELVGTEEKHYE